MSGVVKSVTKVFKSVWDFVAPIAKPVLIAAAAYFTVGVALSAFPATQAFAASLPGFAGGGTLGLGIGEGATAGAGIFSHLAASIGLGSGLAAGSGALSPAITSGAAGTAAASAAAGAPNIIGAGAGAAQGLSEVVAPAAAGSAAATVGGSVAARAGMSITDKLLMASVGTNLVSGLTAPTVRDIAAAKAAFYGSFYGMNADGSGGGAAAIKPVQPTPPKISGTAAPAMQVPGVNIPGQAPVPMGPAGAPSTAATTQASAQQQQLIPTVSYSGQPLPGTTPDFAVTGSTPLSQPRLIA